MGRMRERALRDMAVQESLVRERERRAGSARPDEH
jgi:hypothetical protein